MQNFMSFCQLGADLLEDFAHFAVPLYGKFAAYFFVENTGKLFATFYCTYMMWLIKSVSINKVLER